MVFGFVSRACRRRFVSVLYLPLLQASAGKLGQERPIPFFLWICVSGIVFGVLPAELIVWHYRKIVREASPAGLQ
jgi:hypothetical protein